MSSVDPFHRFAAILAAASPPCDTFKCEKRALCARDELACSAFVIFVRTGKAYSPLLDIDTTGTRARVKKAPILDHPFATRHHFNLADEIVLHDGHVLVRNRLEQFISRPEERKAIAAHVAAMRDGAYRASYLRAYKAKKRKEIRDAEHQRRRDARKAATMPAPCD